MGKILISYNNNVEFSDDRVIVNNQPIEIEKGLNENDTAYLKAREIYRTFLTSNFENYVILTGAGSSIGIGTNNKFGVTMKELWFKIEKLVTRKELMAFCEKIKFEYPPEDRHGDLEALLSRAVMAREFISEKIDEMITQIQDHIYKLCSLNLPENSPHELFLKKITARKLKYPRVKLFTTNYDTLFEQAAGKCGHTVIDGFSYSFPRTFNGSNYDFDFVIREKSRIKNEENYAHRVFHLYKLHGSVDWERENERVIISKNPVEPVMIYPKSTKYESSYEQPFFEMIARFQQALRNENVFLLSIGFSFYDKHISSIIHEALEVNPSFTLMVVTLGIEQNTSLEKLRSLAKQQNNIILLEEKFEDFAREYPFNEIYMDRNGENKYAD